MFNLILLGLIFLLANVLLFFVAEGIVEAMLKSAQVSWREERRRTYELMIISLKGALYVLFIIGFMWCLGRSSFALGKLDDLTWTITWSVGLASATVLLFIFYRAFKRYIKE